MIGGINLIKNGKNNNGCQSNFFLVSFARDASLSPVLIKDNRKHRGIHNEEFKSDTDGKMEAH